MLKSLFVLWVTAFVVSGQVCIGKDAPVVKWWVQLIFPKSVPGQYAYFDSTFSQNQVQNNTAIQFQPQTDSADSPNTAFYKTLNQIQQMSLQYIAWNDQLPNGTTSSVKAHSKAILAFDGTAQNGFYFGHSIPQFPDFIAGVINTTIGSSQRIYGQHAFCITLNGDIIQQMMNKILPMRPFIYSQRNSIVISNTIPGPDYTSLFTYKNYVNQGHNYKFIYKNGNLNGSLFEDGLNIWLNSSLLAKTWGRPIQNSWCDNKMNLSVANVQNVTFSNTSFWKQTQDHSKWVYADRSNYSCFGDANRMSSQWKRGGAFYCIQSYELHKALDIIITQNNSCLFVLFEKIHSFFLVGVAAMLIIALSA